MFITCHGRFVVCGALGSLTFSRRLALSLVSTASRREKLFRAPLTSEKSAVTALVWQIKVPLLPSGEVDSVKAKSGGLADSSAAVALTPAKSESSNFHNFNPESRHNIQTSHGHALSCGKQYFFYSFIYLFYTALLHFQRFFISRAFQCKTYIWSSHPGPFNPVQMKSPLMLESAVPAA